MTELWRLPALEQARLVATRAASAREVMESFLARLDAVNPAINAVVEVRADEALGLADAADAAVKRGEGVPVAYLVGEREFWSLPFEVDSRALIPRPETEVLVEALVEALDPEAESAFADLGTGTGCIAVAALTERSKARALVTDPELILYDEPTAGLDPEISASINRLIAELGADLGVTAIVVTHHIGCVKTVAHQVGLLDGGRLHYVSGPEEFLGSEEPRLVRFLGDRLD